jgi:Protein of unknown function (DUF3179)
VPPRQGGEKHVNDVGAGSRIATSERRTWLVLCAVVLALLAVVLVPALLIRPFKPQTATVVAVAYRFRVAAPWITALGLLPVALLGVRLARRRPRLWQWAPLSLLVGLALTAAWFARQNHFEWMFHPLPHPAYARAAAARFVDDTDMVIAVAVNGDAVAYPVRQMAYHHVVNDVVGGEPIVSTY